MASCLTVAPVETRETHSTISSPAFIIMRLEVLAMRVLILKQEKDAELITKGLGNLGHNFLFAPTIEAAQKMLRENEVDLIIAPSGVSVHTVLDRANRCSTIPFCETTALSATAINHTAFFRKPSPSLAAS